MRAPTVDNYPHSLHSGVFIIQTHTQQNLSILQVVRDSFNICTVSETNIFIILETTFPFIGRIYTVHKYILTKNITSLNCTLHLHHNDLRVTETFSSFPNSNVLLMIANSLSYHKTTVSHIIQAFGLLL
jgi:hypothetical protein